MKSSGNLHPERGQVLVFTAIVILLLVGFLSLIIDAGLAYADRREHQNGADNGALAGARLIVLGENDGATVFNTVSHYVSQNGGTIVSMQYLDASRSPIGSPITSAAAAGAVPGAARGVQVQSQAPMGTIFARVFGTTEMDVGAVGAAVGGPAGLPPTGYGLTPLLVPEIALSNPNPKVFWGSQYAQDYNAAYPGLGLDEHLKAIVDLPPVPTSQYSDCRSTSAPTRTSCFIENGYEGAFPNYDPLAGGTALLAQNTGEYGSNVRDELIALATAAHPEPAIIFVLIFDDTMEHQDPACAAANDYTGGNPDCVHVIGIAALTVTLADIESNSAQGVWAPEAILPLAPIDYSREGDPRWPKALRLVEPGVIVPPAPTSTPAPTATPCVPPVISGVNIGLQASGKKIEADWNTNQSTNTNSLNWSGPQTASTAATNGTAHSAVSGPGNLPNGTYQAWVSSTNSCGSSASSSPVTLTIN